MLKKNFLFEKDFIKSVISIALPIAFQNMISFGVQAMDTVMLGRLGDTAVSAATLGGQPAFLLYLLGFGLTGGGSVLIAQYWGKKNIDVIKKVMRTSMLAITTVSIIVAIICFLFPENIMRIFSKEEAVIAASASYLKVMSIGFVFSSIASNYMISMRAVEKVKMSTLVYSISFFVNVFFNYIFIFGEFGAPELGIVGAAIGTVIARVFEFLCVIIYMYFIEKDIGFQIHCIFKFDKAITKDYLKNAAPVVLNEMVWALGTSTITIVMGRLGQTFVAANSVTMVLFNLANVAIFGIANASAVLSGKTIGSGDLKRAQKVAHTLLLLAVSFGLLGTTLLLLIRDPFLNFYNITNEAKEIARQMIFVLAMLMPLSALDVVNDIGILRGGADTKFAVMLTGCGMWLINVPLGFLTGLVLLLPAPLVFLSMRIDSTLKIPMQLYRILSGKWIRRITNDEL